MAFDALRSALGRDAAAAAVPSSDSAAAAEPTAPQGAAVPPAPSPTGPPTVAAAPPPVAASRPQAPADAMGAIPADPTTGAGIDEVVTGCPSCGRTIPRGTLRCPGCGELLLLDVPMRKAGIFAGAGAAGGVLLTLLLVNLLAPARPPALAGGAGGNGGTGGPGATAGAGGNGAVVVTDIPSTASAALRGTTAINGRLAAEAVPLAGALAAKPFATADVIKALRRMSLDARAGAGMVDQLGAWPDGAAQAAALDAFYGQLIEEIDTGLAASSSSREAYRRAATLVLRTLGTVPRLDADARALAVSAGLDLPLVSFPAVLVPAGS